MAEQILEHYLAAWNETDAAKRDVLLAGGGGMYLIGYSKSVDPAR